MKTPLRKTNNPPRRKEKPGLQEKKPLRLGKSTHSGRRKKKKTLGSSLSNGTASKSGKRTTLTGQSKRSDHSREDERERSSAQSYRDHQRGRIFPGGSGAHAEGCTIGAEKKGRNIVKNVKGPASISRRKKGKRSYDEEQEKASLSLGCQIRENEATCPSMESK